MNGIDPAGGKPSARRPSQPAVAWASHRCGARWEQGACDCWPLLDPDRCWRVHASVTIPAALRRRTGWEVAVLPGDSVSVTAFHAASTPGPRAQDWMGRVVAAVDQSGLSDTDAWEYAEAMARRQTEFLAQPEAEGLAAWLEGRFHELGQVWMEKVGGIGCDDFDCATDASSPWRLDREPGYSAGFPAVAVLWITYGSGAIP